MARLAAIVAYPLLALTACTTDEPSPDPACSASPATVQRALARAPAAVRLPGDVALSTCVADARSDAEIQSAGLLLTRVADRLAERARDGDATAAIELGYLVGAVRRGATRTAGIHAQLVRRIDGTAADLHAGGTAVTVAVRRGIAAGGRDG